jgi:hypothetical protein
VKRSTIIALVIAASMAAPVAAVAQFAEPAPYHPPRVHHLEGDHHYTPHHYPRHAPAAVAAPVATTSAPSPQALPFGLGLPKIAPYPNGKGDEDGLSEDQNDCNKGCIDGNTPN